MAYPLLSFNYNQDFSCISVGTKDGYRIYNCEPFKQSHEEDNGGVVIVEMLFCTSLVALVGAGEQPAYSPRRLKVWNVKTMTSICELNFVSAILAVQLNKKRLVAIMEAKLHIFDLSSLKILQSLDISSSPKGVAALSPNDENCYLAFPNSPSSGEVLVYDALNLQAVTIIQAHKATLSSMAFDSEGKLLATASDKGTVIRVFHVPSGNKLHTFRRGTYPAKIYSLSFNIHSTMLCVSSETGTVHIFKLIQQGTTNSTSSSQQSVASQYLPEMLSDMLEPSRDFAFVKLRCDGVPNKCAINAANTQVMVVTADGYFYQYNLDSQEGGECRLQQERALLESKNDEIEAKFV